MNFEDLQNSNALLFECISGSHAYGLQHKDSDLDKKGVFILPKADFFGLNPAGQLNDQNNDEVYYEIGKFIHLLYKNNPSCLEILNTPAESILYQHPVFKPLNVRDFISKKCKDTFAGFAYAQIKKARGLNKKILNPMEKERKSVLDFCYVHQQQGSIELQAFLKQHNIEQENCGLINIPNMKDLFALFHDEKAAYFGIVKNEQSMSLCLSSIPKGAKVIATLYFNKDGYSVYCKEHKQYWEWVKKRNEHRYQNTLEHGKNYDAKNMMHTFRLLHMAEEIADSGTFSVPRIKDRDFLMEIRSGVFQYEALVKEAEEKISLIRQKFDRSDLPEAPSLTKVNKLLVDIRSEIYL